jgi:hypothetical protein
MAWQETHLGTLNCQKVQSADIHNAWGIGANLGRCWEYSDWRSGIRGVTWNLSCKGDRLYLNGNPPLISVREIAPIWTGGDRTDEWISTVSQHLQEMGGNPVDVTFPFPVTFEEETACRVSGQQGSGVIPEVQAAEDIVPQGVYTVRMYNIDDLVTLYINGSPVYAARWGHSGVTPSWNYVAHQPGNSGEIDITTALSHGTNELRFELWNKAICCGVSVSIEVKENGEIIVVDSFSEQDSSEGVKYNKTYTVIVR